MTTAIRIARPLHAELVYHVLAHLDLGRDAASLYDPGRPARAWAPGLLEAYRRAPGRLALHALPLLVPDLRTLTEQLRAGWAPWQREAGDRALSERLSAALAAERPELERRGEAAAPHAAQRADALLPWLRQVLGRVRDGLWARLGSSPPPLTILDCPSLGAHGGTHGRAAGGRGGRVVAVSLSPDREQVLCQVLHEEVHPVTDPPIRERLAGVVQDTHVGGAGFELHRALERRAVEVGQELVDSLAPEVGAAYARWRRRYGV